MSQQGSSRNRRVTKGSAFCLRTERLESRITPSIGPIWAAAGPASILMGQVEGMATQGNPDIGAIRAIVTHPTDADVLYVGAVNGGVWKTTNATAALPDWTPLTDTIASLSIGALERDPTDSTSQTLLAGIGRFSSFALEGGDLIGLLYTTDGGATFSQFSQLAGRNISSVAARGDVLLAGATNGGLFRSTDRGLTWVTVSAAPGTGLPSGNVSDIHGDPADSSRLYVAVLGHGIYESTDTGATWDSVTGNDPALNQAFGSGISNNNARVAISSSGRIFAGIVNNGRLAYVGYSDDRGGVWNRMDIPQTIEGGVPVGIQPNPRPGAQGLIHFSLAVDPTQPHFVYVGGDRQPGPFPNGVGATNFTGRLFRGDTRVAPTGAVPSPQWTPLTNVGTAGASSPHADSRDIEFWPNGELIEGSDGGLYRRTQPGSTAGDWFSLNGTLQTTEFHSVDWDALTNTIIGGTQDVGTPEQALAGESVWRTVSQGDGGVARVDDISQSGVSTRFSSLQFFERWDRRSIDSAGNELDRTRLGLIVAGSGGQTLYQFDPSIQFYGPYEINAVNGLRMAIGTTRVYESFDHGDNLTHLLGVAGPAVGSLAYGGYLNGVPNEEVLYVGSGSQLYLRSTAGSNLASRSYAGGTIVDLVLDPDDWHSVIVIDNRRVWRSTDAGASFTQITGDISDTNLRTVEYVNGPGGNDLLVVGGDDGVFYSLANAPGHWSELAPALPNAPVTDLVYEASDDVLVAGTLGRGAWTLLAPVSAVDFVVGAVNPAANARLSVLPLTFQLDFPQAIDSTSVQPGDLLVNQLSADDVVLVDADTLEFRFTQSPVTSEGPQSIELPGGAVLRAGDNAGVQAFNSQFYYDLTTLSVIATRPTNGARVTLPLTSLELDFNEGVDAASVAASDLTVSQGTVTDVTVVDADTLRFGLAGLDREGSLSIALAQGTVTDAFGTPIDGYTGSLLLDIATAAIPLPLSAQRPLGSGAFSGQISGGINFADDSDAYEIPVLAGQTVSFVVRPLGALRLLIEARDPTDQVVASASAMEPGDTITLAIKANTAGLHRLVIAADDSATGDYQIDALLQSVLEMESASGATNDTLSTAQEVEPDFQSLPGGSRLAVVAAVADAGLPALATESEPNNAAAVANPAQTSFTPLTGNELQLAARGLITSATDSDWFAIGPLDLGDVLTISASGVASSRGTLGDPILELYRGTPAAPIFVTSNDNSGPGNDPLLFDTFISNVDEYYVRVRDARGGLGTYELGLRLSNTGPNPGLGDNVSQAAEPSDSAYLAAPLARSWWPLRYAASIAGNISTTDVDLYRFRFTAGDLLSVNIDSTAGADTRVALLDAAGTLLAREDGTSTRPGADSPLYAVRIPATGEYLLEVRANSGSGDYSADLRLSTATAPPQTGTGDDFYRVNVARAQSIVAALGGTAGASYVLEIQDAAGAVVASGFTGATNVELLTPRFTAPADGTYYVRVRGPAAEPYQLLLLQDADFDAEPNDSGTPSRDLTGSQGAVGHLDANLVTPAGAYAMRIDTTRSTFILQGDWGGAPFVEQIPGSLLNAMVGHVQVELFGDTLRFINGSTLDPFDLQEPLEPGAAWADYAFNVDVAPGALAMAAMRQFVGDLVNSAALSVDDVGNFDASAVTFQVAAGQLDYALPGVSGIRSLSLLGLSSANAVTSQGVLAKARHGRRLDLPVDVTFTIQEPVTRQDLTFRLTGDLFARLTLPNIDADDDYRLDLVAGQPLTLMTHTPLDQPSSAPLGDLALRIELYDAAGNLVARDEASQADNRNARIDLTVPSTGTYRVRVHAVNGTGQYTLAIVPQPADVVAPSIAGSVTLSSTLGHHAAYPVPTGSGEQLRTVPVGRADTLSVQFTEQVTVAADDFTILGNRGPAPAVTWFGYDVTTATATWRFATPLPADTYTLELADRVRDFGNNALDAEWDNPTSLDDPQSSSSSGNGLPGGSFTFRFTVLPGDADRNNVVDGDDLAILLGQFDGGQGSGTATFAAADFTGDGFVTGADYTLWADHFGIDQRVVDALAIDRATRRRAVRLESRPGRDDIAARLAPLRDRTVILSEGKLLVGARRAARTNRAAAVDAVHTAGLEQVSVSPSLTQLPRIRTGR